MRKFKNKIILVLLTVLFLFSIKIINDTAIDNMEEKARITIETDLLSEYTSYEDVKTGFNPAIRLFVYVSDESDGKVLSFRPTKEDGLNQWRIFLHRDFHYKIRPDLSYEPLD